MVWFLIRPQHYRYGFEGLLSCLDLGTRVFGIAELPFLESAVAGLKNDVGARPLTVLNVVIRYMAAVRATLRHYCSQMYSVCCRLALMV